MKSIPFQDRTQYSFWGNVDYASNKEALKARNAFQRELKQKGIRTRAWSLPGQIRKYARLGQPDGTVGTVYFLDVINV